MSVGKNVVRKDSKFKVSGLTKFVADMSFADILHMKVVRSPHAHAEIINIEIDKDILNEHNAIAFTHEDIPGKNVIHVIFDDWILLAEKRVIYIGDPVAIVLADTAEKAEKAKRAVKVLYKKLEAVFDPVEARDNPSIKIFGENNVFTVSQQLNGNIKEGFKKAEIIIENEYRTPAQDHAYLENHGVVVVPEDDGAITVYFSGQCPFYIQRAVSDILAKPLSKVRVVQAATGGAFGGKEDQPSQLAGLASLGAFLTNRPVSLIYSREEDIETTSKRHPAVVRVKSGITKEGKLVAWQTEYILNTGACATLGPAVLFRGTLHAVGPYYCPNVDVQAYLVATNLVPFGAFRGFGSPQTLFSAEEQMDRLAAEINMDPAEFRRINLLKVGDETSFGQKLDHSVGSVETLDKALERSNWKKIWKKPPTKEELVKAIKNDEKLKGVGISTIFYGVGLGAAGKHMSHTGAYVQLHPDGSVSYAVGTTELGQGMITVLAQIVAESLKIPYEKVSMVPVDTSRVPDSGPTVASRATTFSGRALINACDKLNLSLLKIVSEKFETPIEDLNYKDYSIIDKKGNSIEVVNLLKYAYEKRIRVAEAGWDVAPDTTFDNEKGRGNAYVVYAWCTNVVLIEADVATGEIILDKVYAAHDVGKAINPQALEGQIEGGSLQGAGLGRYEQIVWNKEGKILSNNLGTYIIPASLDSPDIISIIVEHPYNDGPFGAKGIGEQPLMGIAPAITNALYNATGIRLNEIPATPERVWNAIQEKIKED